MGKRTNHNFKLLKSRVLDTNEISNIEKIKSQLDDIKGSVVCVGVGGSSVVSEYAAKIFNIKNNCIAINQEPRDLLYEITNNYENVFACSYSGKNIGVKISLTNNLKKYLFTHNEADKKDITSVVYNTSVEREKSFVSLGATLLPMSILLNYYLDGKNFTYLIEDMFSKVDDFTCESNSNYEIISGMDTSVASKYLESTMVEAGIATPIVHSKYSYCHGRVTLAYNNNNTLIFLQSGVRKDLDELILREAKSLYKEIIILESNYNDIIIDNFNLTLKAMYLTKYLAEISHKDLSVVKYAPAVSRLYHFKGSM